MPDQHEVVSATRVDASMLCDDCREPVTMRRGLLDHAEPVVEAATRTVEQWEEQSLIDEMNEILRRHELEFVPVRSLELTDALGRSPRTLGYARRSVSS